MNISKLSMSNHCFGAKFYNDTLEAMAVIALTESEKSEEKKEKVLSALHDINSLYSNGGIYLRDLGQVYFSPVIFDPKERLCEINVLDDNPNSPIENIIKIAEALKSYQKKHSK